MQCIHHCYLVDVSTVSCYNIVLFIQLPINRLKLSYIICQHNKFRSMNTCAHKSQYMFIERIFGRLNTFEAINRKFYRKNDLQDTVYFGYFGLYECNASQIDVKSPLHKTDRPKTVDVWRNGQQSRFYWNIWLTNVSASHAPPPTPTAWMGSSLYT